MSTQDIIKRILALKPNLTEEAVRELIEKERAKAAGLLTEEAAAHRDEAAEQHRPELGIRTGGSPAMKRRIPSVCCISYEGRLLLHYCHILLHIRANLLDQ